MKYKEAFLYGREAFAECGIGEAELDARLLLEWVCHTSRHDLLVRPESELAESEESAYRQAVSLRCERIPLQHITGRQEFMGLNFQVGPEALIPRQDTECLVEEVLPHLHDGMRILDLCTGSGCILLSLLHYSNDCCGVGTDISADALRLAGVNAARLGGSAVFVQGDLFEGVEGKFDLIVSNPPYIPTNEIPALEAEVRDREPRIALDGSEDGLCFYRRITKEAKSFLNRGGMLFFEIGYDQSQAVQKLLSNEGYAEIKAGKDFAGRDRIVYGIWIDA